MSGPRLAGIVSAMVAKIEVCSIKPVDECVLGHRAYFLRIGPNGQSVVAAKDGEVSVLSERLARTAHFVLPHEVGSVCLASDASRIALTFGGGIKIVSANDGDELLVVRGAFHDAWFDDDGETLWAIRNVSSELVVIEVRSADDLALKCEIDVADPHFASAWSFYPAPMAGSVLVWAAAGQDGQSSFLLKRTAGGVEVNECFPVDTTPPSFSGNGSEFLVCDDCEISRFDFPESRLLGTLMPGEDTRVGYDIYYLSKTRALASLGEGLLGLLDLDAMQIEEPAEIVGYEPKKTCELYPSLADDEELISCLSGLYPQGPEYFLSSHLVLPASSNQQHVLVRWRNPTLPPNAG